MNLETGPQYGNHVRRRTRFVVPFLEDLRTCLYNGDGDISAVWCEDTYCTLLDASVPQMTTTGNYEQVSQLPRNKRQYANTVRYLAAYVRRGGLQSLVFRGAPCSMGYGVVLHGVQHESVIPPVSGYGSRGLASRNPQKPQRVPLGGVGGRQVAK